MKLKQNEFYRSLSICLCFLMAGPVFVPYAGKAHASGTNQAIGHIFASDGGTLRLPSGDQVEIGKASVPLFSGSRIKAKGGNISMNVAGAGIVEGGSDSEFEVARSNEGISVNLINGGMSFSISGTTGLAVTTQVATISRIIKTSSLDSGVSGMETRGVVVMDGDAVLVRSIQGDLTVLTQDGQGAVVKTGEAIKIAQVKPKTGGSPQGVVAKPSKSFIDKTAAALGVSKGAAVAILAVSATAVVVGGAVAVGSSGGGGGGGSSCP